jgi:hypothetical protein
MNPENWTIACDPDNRGRGEPRLDQQHAVPMDTQ